MTFKEIIDNVKWSDIKKCLIRNYYSESPENVPVYKKVLLLLKKKQASESNMRICVERYTEDDESYCSVCALAGIKKKDSEDFKDFKLTKKQGEEEVSYGIGFTEWSEWLGMKIDKKTVKNFTKDEIVSHCLWEMTFYGYQEKRIQAEITKLKKMVRDIKKGVKI